MRPENSTRFFAVASIAIFLLFFRPSWAWTLYGDHDDLCYFNWLLTFLNVPHSACYSSSYLPGISVLWLPASALSLLSRALFMGEFLTWLQVWIGLSSFGFWVATLFLAERVRRHFDNGSSLWSLLFILSAPALYYATTRTTIAHAGEFLLSFAVVFMVCRKRFGWGVFFSLILAATRINDLPAILFCLAGLLKVSPRRYLVWVECAIALAFVLLFKLVFVDVYNATPLLNLLERLSLQNISHSFYALLLASDWGLLWSGFSYLAIFFCGLFFIRRLTWTGKTALFWMFSNLVLCLSWGGNGSDFGFRYLIGSFAAAFVVFLELKVARTFLKVAVAISACWVTFLTWIYKSELIFFPYLNPEGRWILPQFQKHAFQRLFEFSQVGKPFNLSMLSVTYSALIGETRWLDLYPRYMPLVFSAQVRGALFVAALTALMALIWIATTPLRSP